MILELHCPDFVDTNHKFLDLSVKCVSSLPINRILKVIYVLT